MGDVVAQLRPVRMHDFELGRRWPAGVRLDRPRKRGAENQARHANAERHQRAQCSQNRLHDIPLT
jgi:hypothetical protein